MSEYQYVFFAAIDRPLDDKQLAYMRRQSTRADVTRWQFENEYYYGDFGGNAVEMMRRGYDIHLHYAKFGIRKLMFRLPQGLPISRTACKSFELKYYEAASILSEMRDTLGESEGPRRANVAKELVRLHPTLSYLKRALKEQGLAYR